MVNILSIVGLVLTVVLLIVALFYSKALLAKAKTKALENKEKSEREIESFKAQQVRNAIGAWKKKKFKEDRELRQRQSEIRKMESLYNQRLSYLDRRLQAIDKKEIYAQSLEQKLEKRSRTISQKEREVKNAQNSIAENLAEVAQMTIEEAKEALYQKVISSAKLRAAKELKEIKEKVEITANEQAANILATTIQRIALDQATETTVNVVSLPSDEMKGRIIGREGRNIRSFELATGADIVIDDTPGAVVLSCFDPVKREVAKISLQKLISDGRIHPARIEEVVEKSKTELEDKMLKLGQDACLELNIRNISQNLVRIIGRLNYRTSYGQNILKHSIETAYIAGIIAAELRLDQKIAKRAGFLHDIGKALDHSQEGSHAEIGGKVARKNGESKIIINAIEAHHEEVEAQTIFAVIAQTADAISGARPGARREMLESYVQRLKQLEKIATSVEGVRNSYAIQAGRELRVIVNPTHISDAQIETIVDDIIKKIEAEVQYPGQIKVTVIREKRVTGIAV